MAMFVVKLWQDPGGVLLGRSTQLEFQFGFVGLLVPYEPGRVLTGPLLGHPVKAIACRLEAIRLAMAGPAAAASDSPG